MQATALPLWAFALAAAVFAPFCARAVGQALDKRARERTLLALGGRLDAVGSKRVLERPNGLRGGSRGQPGNTEADAPPPDS